MQPGSGKNWEAGAKLLKLALAQYRNESILTPEAEPTEAMLILLRLANGDAELMAWAIAITGTDADEVHRCCIAYIEREFFGGDTDPYCVLGLNPWAAAADIKEHYRLLIRLFHPDRGLVNSASAETYAAMINQAYAALKKLASVDTGLLPNQAPAVAFRANRASSLRRHFIRSVAIEHAGIHTWRWLSWLTPVKVLFSFAVMATLIVTIFFLQENRSKASSFDAGVKAEKDVSDFTFPVETQQQQVQDAVQMPEPPSEAPLPETPALVEAPSASMSQEILTAKNVVTEPAKALKKKVVVATTASAVSADNSYTQKLPLAEKVVTPIAVENNKSSHEVLVAPKVNVVNSHNAGATSPATTANQSTVSIEKLPETPSDQELHDLIAQFMGSYSQGDVSEFMQVFDERVHTDEAGGKQGLQNTYARFFSNTTSRAMVLKDLQWKRSGGVAIGRADYQASTSRADDEEPSISFGTLRFEVAKTGTAVMITGFYHQAAKK